MSVVSPAASDRRHKAISECRDQGDVAFEDGCTDRLRCADITHRAPMLPNLSSIPPTIHGLIELLAHPLVEALGWILDPARGGMTQRSPFYKSEQRGAGQ